MSDKPTEAQIHRYGTTVAKAQYANATLTFVDIGIQLFMCIYGLSVFLETPKEKRKGRFPFILISFIIWSTSTFTAAIDSYIIFQTLFDSGPTGRSYVMEWRKHGAGEGWWNISSTTTLLIYIAVGDCLMLYRCFILWRNRWWIMVLPISTFLFSIAAGIASVYPFPRFVSRLPTTTWTFASVAMNIMVTVLIILPLAHGKRNLRKTYPSLKTNLHSGIIVMIIESAAPLTFFGICFGIMLIVLPRLDTLDELSSAYAAETTFGLLYYSFCAISPQMVIFRVTTGRSWLTNYDSDPATAAFSRPLEFSGSRPLSGGSQRRSMSSVDVQSNKDGRSAS